MLDGSRAVLIEDLKQNCSITSNGGVHRYHNQGFHNVVQYYNTHSLWRISSFVYIEYIATTTTKSSKVMDIAPLRAAATKPQ
jgi:hypothetical protein